MDIGRIIKEFTNVDWLSIKTQFFHQTKIKDTYKKCLL